MDRLRLPSPLNVLLAFVVQLLIGKAKLVVVRTLTGPFGTPLAMLRVM